MPDPSRKLRGLVYLLGDLESSLKNAGLADSATDISTALKRLPYIPPPDFLDTARMAVESILLSERNLSARITGELIDALAAIDAALVDLL